MNDGIIQVSIRTKNIPINSFAEQFGGGGHVFAVGFTLQGTLAEIVVQIIPKLNKFINAGI